MANSIYIVNPAGDFPAYLGAEVYAGWGLRPKRLPEGFASGVRP